MGDLTDVEKVRNFIEHWGSVSKENALAALARLEAEHNMRGALLGKVACMLNLHGRGADPGTEDFAKAVNAMRADSERLRKADAHALAERAWETLRTYSAERHGMPMADWREGPQAFRDHRVALVRVLLTLLLETP